MSNKQTLHDLFANAYDRDKWLEQLHTIFAGSIDEFSQPLSIDTDQAKTFSRLGNLTTSDGKQLSIFEIQIDKGTQLARNRVQLRNLVAQRIQDADGALAVYYDEGTHWRFSYIVVEYKLDDKGQQIKDETARKRYTYLLGKDAQVRTAVDRFAALKSVPTLEQLSKAFAVEALNKEFYQKLYQWYKHAQDYATFPNDERVKDDEHATNSLIRLLTRLLFVWFLKEKELVNPNLFDEDKVKQLIDWEKPSSFYKAILQNLFFATLNREIEKRGFRTTTNGKADGNNYLVTNIYRYQNLFLERNENAILELFAQTPFLNGGLFECLDREASEEEIAAYNEDKSIRNERYAIRIDGFSDRNDNKVHLPNRLFFNESEQQPGLIDLLSQYQFTVEESLPLDIEVALDPELLGKVFENLLATYNPETRERETARKSSGSYYTPREIVSYMVDESLKAYLSQSVTPEDGDVQFFRERLDYLFKTADNTGQLDFEEEPLIYPTEIGQFIKALSEARIIDPAVGSGAFPMGMLQRMVNLLATLDPRNQKWKAKQLEQLPDLQSIEQDLKTTENINDLQARDEAKNILQNRRQEVIDLFNKQDHNYLRKLYLIENCIFGVDIQPIACQIAKLRFFISLVIEQERADSADNYGILPLPNLETKFVAADSLIGLNAPKQLPLRDREIENREKRLRQIRHDYFNAKTLKTKRKYRALDKQMRAEIAELLRKDGWDDKNAQQIAHWDPYDQSASPAKWYDSKWMFGITKGFDIVISNPPYIEARNNLLSRELKDLYQVQTLADWGKTLPRGSDILVYFYTRSAKLLSDSGYGCFITQNAWLNTDYGKKFQEFSIGRFSFQKIIDTSAKFFSDTKSQNINTIITIFTMKKIQNIKYEIANIDMMITSKKTIEANQKMKWGIFTSMPQFFMDILSRMLESPNRQFQITFGQGINPPKEELNKLGADIPVIVRDSKFVATSADGRVHHVHVRSRMNKIPALIMPRGIGERYYCTFNLCKAFSYSGVELYMPSELWESDVHYSLWAYLNSSLVWLFREITGRKNLGGGMLKAEATDMKSLPINFNFGFAEKAKKVFESIKNREPKPVSEEVYTAEHLLIDDMVADHFGFQDMQEDIRNALVEHVNFRMKRARPHG